jgi:hypothetical protein
MNVNGHLEKLLKTISDNQYIGLGNPNAKILFIGKEAGTEIETKIFHGSVKSWKKKEFKYSEKFIPKEKKIRNLNHTWQRYQKLYDCILSELEIKTEIEKKDKYEISFVENVFTTEFSNLHAPNTKDAKKQENFGEELKVRKDVFFKSEFIKQFPIIVIFASDNKYIENYTGEVCELFNLKFNSLHNETAKDKIWVHNEMENEKKPRLLIHTRQLTNRITPELIPNICELIVKFIKKNSIKIN